LSEPKVTVEPDPRISTLRPAWLTDDTAWSDQLQAMDLDEDIRWIERHWADAGGAKPAVDTSWLTYHKAGPVREFGEQSVFWPLATLVVFIVVCFGGLMLFVGGGQ
jgi:hypothetical protein